MVRDFVGGVRTLEQFGASDAQVDSIRQTFSAVHPDFIATMKRRAPLNYSLIQGVLDGKPGMFPKPVGQRRPAGKTAPAVGGGMGSAVAQPAPGFAGSPVGSIAGFLSGADSSHPTNDVSDSLSSAAPSTLEPDSVMGLLAGTGQDDGGGQPVIDTDPTQDID
jgi:hypothetical protein